MLTDDSHFCHILKEARSLGSKWAIAISGGADSLCLFLVIKEYIEKNLLGIELCLITVNHNLRTEVIKEIEFLEQLAVFHTTELVILKWEHDNEFVNNLYNDARKNRYKLLIEYCSSQNINVIFTAHHLADQIETFKMRLTKGMGVDGLTCIYPKIIHENVTILRPFLEVNPVKIRHYLSEKNQLWIEEKTNYSTVFARASIRSNIQDISENKIFDKNISLVVKKILLAKEALEFYTNLEYGKIVSVVDDVLYVKVASFINLPTEISIRVLRKILISNRKGKRILFSELLVFRQKMIELLIVSEHGLQFGNFIVFFEEDCYIFMKKTSSPNRII